MHDTPPEKELFQPNLVGYLKIFAQRFWHLIATIILFVVYTFLSISLGNALTFEHNKIDDCATELKWRKLNRLPKMTFINGNTCLVLSCSIWLIVTVQNNRWLNIKKVNRMNHKKHIHITHSLIVVWNNMKF